MDCMQHLCSSDDQNKNNLDEVSFMRPILILLLVAYHSFCPFSGEWGPFDGYIPIEIYKWLDRVLYAFMLESFVFISGYVWSYQRNEQNRYESLWKLCKKKFSRLFVPSIVFSILYLLIFSPDLLLSNKSMGGVYMKSSMAQDIYGFCQCYSGVSSIPGWWKN